MGEEGTGNMETWQVRRQREARKVTMAVTITIPWIERSPSVGTILSARMNSPNSHNNPMKLILLWSPFHRRGKCEPRALKKSCQVTKLVALGKRMTQASHEPDLQIETGETVARMEQKIFWRIMRIKLEGWKHPSYAELWVLVWVQS